MKNEEKAAEDGRTRDAPQGLMTEASGSGVRAIHGRAEEITKAEGVYPLENELAARRRTAEC